MRSVSPEWRKFKLEMLESAKRHKEKSVNKWGYEHWDYTPTGNLAISLQSRYLSGYQKNWSDMRSKSLEDRLGKIVALFEIIPDIIHTKKEEERLEQLARQRRELCRRRRNDVLTLTQKRAEHINQLVKDLDRAKTIRAWIGAVEQSENPPASTKRLARWAAQYANHIDPLVDFRLLNLDREIEPKKYWWS